MLSGMSLLLVLSVASAMALIVGVVVGRRTGKSAAAATPSGRASLDVEALHERTRRLTRELTDTQHQQQRTLGLLINLPETVNKMGAARSTQDLCRVTARALTDLVGASRMGLFLPQGSPARYVLEVAVGVQQQTAEVSFVAGQGRLGQLVNMVGVRDHGDVGAAPSGATAADTLFKPDLCVAMRRHETTYAFICMDDLRLTDNMTKRAVQMIADVHAVSAEGVAALDVERARADLDQLTGQYNRRHLDHRLPDEIARARAYEMPLSVFLFDIDNFKHYNDANGHQAGDDCLRSVAGLARRVTRSSDVVCRYGGEEFLVILLGADRAQAWHHAERIRATIAGALFPFGPGQPLGRVSISGGLASFPADAQDATTLIKLADEALYKAKQAGRNRVLAAGGATPT